jgi:hypothetical protein
VFPAVPLAWAFRAAGHDVLVGTASVGLAARDAGLPVADIAPDLNVHALFGQAITKHPELRLEVQGEAMRDVGNIATLFAEVSRGLIEPAVRLARSYRPDLVVCPPMHGGALVAAAALGVPTVDLGFGFARTSQIPDLMYERLVDEFTAHGATGLSERRVSLDVAPASMVDTQAGARPMRYVPYNGGAVLPDWLVTAEKAERPRVAVTLGTVSPQLGGVAAIKGVITAAADVDAEFVLALGDADLDVLGTLPDNVRTGGWLPLGALLTTCAGVIHHGGGGTTLTALDAAVPQLVLPDGADRYINADAVARRGAGIAASASDVDDTLLRTLVTDEELRSVSAEVRAEMATMPTPTEIAAELADLR